MSREASAALLRRVGDPGGYLVRCATWLVSKYMACEDQATVAKSAIFARLERQVGPDGTLPSDERARLVRAAAGELSARLNAAKARKRTRPSG